MAAVGVISFGMLLCDFLFPPRFHVPGPDSFSNEIRNIGLIFLFGLQHSVMARKSFKTFLASYFPIQLERNLYVLFSGFCLLALAGLWNLSESIVWDFRESFLSIFLYGLFAVGLLILFLGSISINPGGLTGFGNLLENLDLKKPDENLFRNPGIYKIFRHPIYLGLLIMFWASPRMTSDHLVFCIAFTVYISIGTWLEEKDLIQAFRNKYSEYKKRTGFFGPKIFRHKEKNQEV